MIAVRKDQAGFGRGNFQWVDVQNPAIAAYTRIYQGESVLAVHNLRDVPQGIALELKKSANELTDLLTKKHIDLHRIELAPYQFLWLK
jgi:hypothetical protein